MGAPQIEDKEYDVEASGGDKHGISATSSSEFIGDEGAVHAEAFVIGDSWYAKSQRFATKFGVEARGIERVPSDERTDGSMSKIGTLVGTRSFPSWKPSQSTRLTFRDKWLSANMVVSAFAIGALAYPVFYLGFVDTILTIFFVNILGILPVCFFSTFGPRFGLRQMVLSRFFFGWYGVKISTSPSAPFL